jgi:hypothetical protein
MITKAGHPPRSKASYEQEESMTTSLRALSLQFALALGVAALASVAAGSARAATHPPMLASDTGWPGELVNRPGCAGDGDYDARPACEAVRR